MNVTRYHLVWMGLTALVGFAEVTTATPATSGMLAKSVCISPMTLLVVTITPVETLSNVFQDRLRRGGNGGASA